MKKNYSRPAMVMETFVPNEYCDSCWLVTLDCLGQSSTQGWDIAEVYPWGTTNKHDAESLGSVHYQGHSPHTTPIITVHIEGDETFNPANIDDYEIVDGQGLEERPGVGTGENGKVFTPGYYWYQGGGIHFATSLNYTQNQLRPNAS